MFTSKLYIDRREKLCKQLKSGLILLPGNVDVAMNYKSNVYPFRQDSAFLYYFGLDSPGLFGVIDIDSKREMLFGDDPDMDDLIWMGNQIPLKERCLQSGVIHVYPSSKLNNTICEAIRKGQKVHFLPPYRPRRRLLFEELLGIKANMIDSYVSKSMIKAVFEQMSVKNEQELLEIENTLTNVTYPMFLEAMQSLKPGVFEYEIAGRMEGVALSRNSRLSYPIILTKNGHILHNHAHNNMLQRGDILLIDAGADSPMHYATDISRSFPVRGTFDQREREIYEVVLKAQKNAIKAIKPGITYLDIHLQACKIITQGLKDIGIMKGNVDYAVKNGAHALFMPHGLGHLLGLDVHDMEGLGEDYIGYDENQKRSTQFGLAYLRLARKLKPGYVLTVEPGIYFIPALIDKWRYDKKCTPYIRYDKLEQYRTFGGIRIEDNIVVTDNGAKVLGKPIPKEIKNIEGILSDNTP